MNFQGFEVGGLYMCLLILKDLPSPERIHIPSNETIALLLESFPNYSFLGELGSIGGLKNFDKMEPFYVVGHDEEKKTIEIFQTTNGESFSGIVKYDFYVYDPLWKERKRNNLADAYKTAIYRLL